MSSYLHRDGGWICVYDIPRGRVGEINRQFRPPRIESGLDEGRRRLLCRYLPPGRERSWSDLWPAGSGKGCGCIVCARQKGGQGKGKVRGSLYICMCMKRKVGRKVVRKREGGREESRRGGERVFLASLYLRRGLRELDRRPLDRDRDRERPPRGLGVRSLCLCAKGEEVRIDAALVREEGDREHPCELWRCNGCQGCRMWKMLWGEARLVSCAKVEG